MSVRYSKHLQERLLIRNIPDNLPRSIIESAKRRYRDNSTNTLVAVKRIFLHGQLRDVAVVYIEDSRGIIAITVHPIRKSQINNRLKFGRWKNS